MVTIKNLSTASVARFLSNFPHLSFNARQAIAEFIDKHFPEGIDADDLIKITRGAKEYKYDNLEELADDYLDDNEIDELIEQARAEGDENNWPELALELLADNYSYSTVVLPCIDGNAVVIDWPTWMER